MPDPYVELVNKTGFPLQIALAHLVHANMDSGWRVMYAEHSWRNERENSSGYADLVLENVARDVVLVLECKRIQEAPYVFLPQEGKSQDVARIRALRLQRNTNFEVEQGFPIWTDQDMLPKSPEVAFCVVSKDARDRTVEVLASELVSATEAVEEEERLHCPERSRQWCRVFISAIVTTAPLFTCEFDPSTVNLSNGKIPAGAATKPVNMIRFRKQLGTPGGPQTEVRRRFAYDVGRLADSKERTVLMMHSEYLITFLRAFSL
jgi:hypothetical protein